MKNLMLAMAAQGAGFWIGIAVVPPGWCTVAIFVGTAVSAYLLRPPPVPRVRERTASIALERMFWVAGHDRVRTRDSRELWWLK